MLHSEWMTPSFLATPGNLQARTITTASPMRNLSYKNWISGSLLLTDRRPFMYLPICLDELKDKSFHFNCSWKLFWSRRLWLSWSLFVPLGSYFNIGTWNRVIISSNIWLAPSFMHYRRRWIRYACCLLLIRRRIELHPKAGKLSWRWTKG